MLDMQSTTGSDTSTTADIDFTPWHYRAEKPGVTTAFFRGKQRVVNQALLAYDYRCKQARKETAKLRKQRERQEERERVRLLTHSGH